MTNVAVLLLRRLLGLAVVFVVFGFASVRAGTFIVNSTADEVDINRGDGVCQTASGVCTLRAAIQESNFFSGADTIVLPAGTYVITSRASGDAGGNFEIDDDLTIRGAGAGVTIIDGGAIDRVFSLAGSSTTVTISNLRIQNGSVSAFDAGGGIFVRGSNRLTLSDVVIQNNHAGDGGGIFNEGTLTLIRSVVEGNSAVRVDPDSIEFRRGGGIFHSAGTLTIRESTIRDNTAVSGGGLFSTAAAVIESSTISGNIAVNRTLNSGDGGGGIVNGEDSPGTMRIVNSTISGNRANSHFGGVYNANGSIVLSNVTITDNLADADSDGLGNGGGLSLSNRATGTMRNTIVAGNRAAGSAKDCRSVNASALTSAGYNLVGNVGAASDCAFVAGAGDQIGVAGSPIDASLEPLNNNGGTTATHALLEASPAVDAGDPAGCTDGTNVLEFDQRGVPRATPGRSGAARCDIGAYEFGRSIINANAGSDQRVNSGVVVALDGSASTGAIGAPAYAWVQTAGVAVALAAANTATPSFTAPPVAGALTFQLTVTDRYGSSGTDTVSVTVNGAPMADAGADQTVNAGATVALNGTASRDADGSIVGYAWVQTGGGSVVLANADTATPSFTAPAAAATLTFQLTVRDNDGATHSDSVTVTVTAPPAAGNQPPVANAGRDETVRPRSIVVLNGWHSYDPDGKIVSYRWKQTAGARVTLYGAHRPWVAFIAPKVEGPLTFELTVTDNKGATSTDLVTVTVDDCARWWWWHHHHHHGCRQ